MNYWPDYFTLEERMFELQHNLVDIQRFEHGILQECKRDSNQEFWKEIDFLKANLQFHIKHCDEWYAGPCGKDQSRALAESRNLITILKPLFTGDDECLTSLQWGKWNIKHPY
jgi:hypothetical protein|tara:strand:- start:719 stop:1057 length:339 start_codon:yes stop_codon:yes gene_type:complete